MPPSNTKLHFTLRSLATRGGVSHPVRCVVWWLAGGVPSPPQLQPKAAASGRVRLWRKSNVVGRGSPTRRLVCGVLLLLACLECNEAEAQVPGLINYQGRVAVGRTDFDGQGNFRLALINADGSQVYWRNAADSNSDGVPDSSVLLTVSRGLFSVQLGDTTLPNMAPLNLGVFSNNVVYLRVWFDDGANGLQRLAPDQRVVSVGYAMMAAAVPDGAITPEKFAPAALQVFTALSNRLNAIEALIPSGLTIASPEAANDSLVTRGFQPFTSIAAPGWVSGPTADVPSARYSHTAIWTGQELVVWGGTSVPGQYLGSGSMYRPDLNQWRATASDAAPVARSGHSTVWAGQELIVWGGFSGSGYLRSGGRFNPGTQTWAATSATGAPAEREGHAAVWTGSRMVVWGGRNAEGPLGDCFLYDPAADQWTAVSAAGGPSARFGAGAVWTGQRLVVWGGEGSEGALGTGGRLIFTSGVPTEWLAVSTVNAPLGRTGHTAIWTGQRLIVWGGQRSGVFLGDGGIYDPVANSWEPVPASGAPAPRSGHNAVWTGTEMLILYGETAFGAVASGSAFNPATGKWRSISTGGNPQARAVASAVWAGTEVLVFGGRNGSQPVSALERLNPQPTWYLYRKP